MNAIKITTYTSVICAALVILSAGILGYTALYDLFVSIGLFSAWLGIFFPLLFDLAEVAAAVAVFNAKLQGEDDKFAWGMVIFFTLLGIVANIAHAGFAWYVGKIGDVQLYIAIGATSLFPLSVALVTHLVKRVIARAIARQGTINTLTQLTTLIDEKVNAVANLTRQEATLIEQVDTLRQTVTEAAPTNPRSAAKLERMTAMKSYLLANPYTGLTEAAGVVGITRQTAGEYVRELGLHRNGNGWEVTL